MTRMDSGKFLESQDFLFHAALYRFSSGEIVPSHSHEFIELAYVAQGQGEHYYKGEYYNIAEGDVFMIEPNEEHAYRAGHTHLPVVYNVLFQPELLRRELEPLADVASFVDFFYLEPFLRKTVRFQGHLRLKPYEQIEMESLLHRLILDFKEKKLGYRILTKTRLIELFIFLSRCHHDRKHSPLQELSSDEKVILHISEFIRKHYAQPLTLAQVSEMCRMSQTGFSTKFKQYIGKTFTEFRNETRIRVAKQLLEQSDRKIMEVAQDVGYEDLSFFNKMFKHMVGFSPSQYRNAATTATHASNSPPS
ncbi:AraC family transcriptional regulator [Paenibacillus cineris]|uniref:Transcriptional regulator n=2 Tax=Paenibacillus TaxID=44249 RepID=A0ABQ4LD01_9BACL|nr:AraC family transcriptional regulator [Paenibacillus cineris]GIO54443.1 transcriptional regulator [Paenibacillus cineris]